MINSLCFPTVTIIASILMGMLFFIELNDYLSVQVSEELFVDTSRIPTMRINFNVTFPKIACSCKRTRRDQYFQIFISARP